MRGGREEKERKGKKEGEKKKKRVAAEEFDRASKSDPVTEFCAWQRSRHGHYFSSSFSNSGGARRGEGGKGGVKRNKEKRWIRVKGSEFVATAGTDFIGLSSLFISLLQEVQPSHFHPLSNLTTNPVSTLSPPYFLSRSFSLSPSLSLHFHSDTSIQRRSTPFPT